METTNETLKEDISSRIDVLIEEQENNDNFEEMDKAITNGMLKINLIMQGIVLIAAVWQLLKYIRNSPFLTETLKIFTNVSSEFYTRLLKKIKEIVNSTSIPEERLYELISLMENVEDASNKLKAIKASKKNKEKEK